MPLITIQVDHFFHPSQDVQSVLASLANLKEIIMATKAEFAADINATADKVVKVIGEFTAATAQMAAAIEAAGNSSPEEDAALARLKAAVQQADDLNPDAPEPEPAPAPETPAEPEPPLERRHLVRSCRSIG